MLGKGFVSAIPSPLSHSRGPGDQDREAASQSKQCGAAVQVSAGQHPASNTCPLNSSAGHLNAKTSTKVQVGKRPLDHIPSDPATTSTGLNWPSQVPWDSGPPQDLVTKGLRPGTAGVSQQGQTEPCPFLNIPSHP